MRLSSATSEAHPGVAGEEVGQAGKSQDAPKLSNTETRSGPSGATGGVAGIAQLIRLLQQGRGRARK
jgi:hypothetical protein